jgi:hypothetical protein
MTETWDTKAASVMTKGAMAIIEEGPLRETETIGSETEADLQWGQIEIETETKIATEIAWKTLVEIETVRGVAGETMIGAEVETDIAALKVCIIHCPGYYVQDAHEVQNMLHHDQIMRAGDQGPVRQLATALTHPHAPDLLHVGRKPTVIDHPSVIRPKMKTSVPSAPSPPSPTRRLRRLIKKRLPMATKILSQMKTTKMLCLGRWWVSPRSKAHKTPRYRATTSTESERRRRPNTGSTWTVLEVSTDHWARRDELLHPHSVNNLWLGSVGTS